MANRQRGEVAFDALGKSWTLKFGTNAICEVEASTGKSINAVGSLLSDSATATMGLMRTVFWAGLRHHHKEISADDAGNLIDDVGAVRAGELMAEAFKLAFPQEEKDGPARPLQATAA